MQTSPSAPLITSQQLQQRQSWKECCRRCRGSLMAPKGSCEPCAKQRSDTFRRLQGRSKSHQTRTTQIKGATTAEQQPQLEQQQQAAVEAERVSKLNLADVTAKLLDARWTTQQLEIAAATAQSAAAEIKELKGQDQAARRQQQQQQQQQVQCATSVEQQPAAADERQPRLPGSAHWCSGHSSTCLMMTKAVATVTVVRLMMTAARQITTVYHCKRNGVKRSTSWGCRPTYALFLCKATFLGF